MKVNFEKTNTCPNCSTELNGENFCPQCGQKNDIRRFTFWHFIAESVSHFLAFDGRFFTTLRVLVSRPGRVPKEYIEGKRMKYLNPLRLYFISSLLLLFTAQLGFDGTEETRPEIEDTGTLTSSRQDSMVSAELEALPGVPLNLTLDTATQPEFFGKMEKMLNYSETFPSATAAQALPLLNIENTFWNRFLYHQAAKTSNFDRDEFNQYLRSKMFWVLFFFLPILALLLKLLYIRRDFYYTEHLFFTFYSQAVFFFLISLVLLLPDSNYLIPAACLLFFVYLFLSMRRFYQQGFSKTTFKIILLNLLAIPAFGAFFLLATIVVFILF